MRYSLIKSNEDIYLLIDRDVVAYGKDAEKSFKKMLEMASASEK